MSRINGNDESSPGADRCQARVLSFQQHVCIHETVSLACARLATKYLSLIMWGGSIFDFLFIFRRLSLKVKLATDSRFHSPARLWLFVVCPLPSLPAPSLSRSHVAFTGNVSASAATTFDLQNSYDHAHAPHLSVNHICSLPTFASKPGDMDVLDDDNAGGPELQLLHQKKRPSAVAAPQEASEEGDAGVLLYYKYVNLGEARRSAAKGWYLQHCGAEGLRGR